MIPRRIVWTARSIRSTKSGPDSAKLTRPVACCWARTSSHTHASIPMTPTTTSAVPAMRATAADLSIAVEFSATTSSSVTSAGSCDTSGGRELVGGELVAQVLLRKLADARLRNLVDEHDVVRQPPLGNSRLEPTEQLLAGELLSRLQHDT